MFIERVEPSELNTIYIYVPPPKQINIYGYIYSHAYGGTHTLPPLGLPPACYLPVGAHFLHSCAIDVFIMFKQSPVIQCLDVNKSTRSRALSMCKNQQQTVFLLSCIHYMLYDVCIHIWMYLHFMYFECKLNINNLQSVSNATKTENRFHGNPTRTRQTCSTTSCTCATAACPPLSSARHLSLGELHFVAAIANPSMSGETDCGTNHVRNCNCN